MENWIQQKLITETNIEFDSISCEEFRVYEFIGYNIKINKPLWLNISSTGGHRIMDEEGKNHYIPTGWKHLWWVAKPGEPRFVR